MDKIVANVLRRNLVSARKAVDQQTKQVAAYAKELKSARKYLREYEANEGAVAAELSKAGYRIDQPSIEKDYT